MRRVVEHTIGIFRKEPNDGLVVHLGQNKLIFVSFSSETSNNSNNLMFVSLIALFSRASPPAAVLFKE